MNKQKITLVLACAGKGSRANLSYNKIFAKIDGEAVITKTFSAFNQAKKIDEIIIVHGKGEKEQAKLDSLERSCYVCDRVNLSFLKMMDNMVYLWETEEDFREKFKNQKYFCLPHYKQLLEFGRNSLGKKQFAEYFKQAREIEKAYIASLGEDVSWFCKKFDYRYDNEPWYNAKDAIPRALAFLSGGSNKR